MEGKSESKNLLGEGMVFCSAFKATGGAFECLGSWAGRISLVYRRSARSVHFCTGTKSRPEVNLDLKSVHPDSITIQDEHRSFPLLPSLYQIDPKGKIHVFTNGPPLP